MPGARLRTPRRQAAFLQERPEELQRQLRVTDRDALDQHRSSIGQLRGPEQLGGRIGGLDQPRRELQPLRFGGGSARPDVVITRSATGIRYGKYVATERTINRREPGPMIAR